MASALSGIFVPTLAAVSPDGSLNESATTENVRWLLDRGVAGIYPNGSTGEFLRLDEPVQDRITALTVEACGSDGLVLGGAAGATAPLALNRCEALADMGCRAAAVVAPFYYGLGDAAVERFYRDLAAESPIDLLLYNIPLFASRISADVVARLALDCPRIIGIKDSSGDLAHMQRMLAAVRPHRPDFTFFTGWDNVLASMLLLGCDGGTDAAANVVPEVLVQIHDSVLDGDLRTARHLQTPLAALFDAMIGCGEFPDGFRIAAAARGRDVATPILPRSETQQRELDALAERMPDLLKPFESVLKKT